MADEFDDLRSKFQVGDGFDDLRAKFGASPVAPARQAGVDMGPEARRARGGGSPSRPKDITAEEAGTSPGVIRDASPRSFLTRLAGSRQQAPAPADLGPDDEVTVAARHPGEGFGVLGKFGRPATLTVGRPQGEMADPLAQMATATALGMAAGAPVRAIPAIGGTLGSAVEGGVANKAAGGDFTTGAALGLAPAAIRGVSRTLSGGGNRVVSDVIKGAKKAPARLANEVKFKAGEGGAELTEVLAEVPAARRAVTVKARTNPGGAAADITKVIDKAVDANDAAYAAIQRQHGGVPLQPIAERLAGLEERLNLQGRGVAADAVNRVRTDLLKRYGAGPEGLEGVKLSAQQIRNIRNDLGTIADPARTIKPNTRRQALSKIYNVLNKEIDDVAAQTRGVNLDEFKARNRQISTLIPVRDALAARAEAEGERGIIQKAKALPGDAFRRTAREIDVAASKVPDLPTAAPIGVTAPLRGQPAAPAQQPRKKRNGEGDDLLAMDDE